MSDQDAQRQDERRGGYGDSTGGRDPGGQEEAPTGATGRENPVTDAGDADEALGNRTGGYGSNPPAEGETDAP